MIRKERHAFRQWWTKMIYDVSGMLPWFPNSGQTQYAWDPCKIRKNW